MESITTNRVRKLLNWLVRSSFVGFVFVLGGCPSAPPPEPVEVDTGPQAPVLYEHQVRYQGETLGLIARWYTGKSSNWKLIVDANPGMRPERINIGDNIMIPQELVVQEEPLPKRAIPSRGAGDSESAGSEESAAGSVDAAVGAATGANVPAGAATQGDKPADFDQLEQALEAALGEREQQGSEQQGTASVEEPAPEAQGPEVDEDAERERLLDELLSE